MELPWRLWGNCNSEDHLLSLILKIRGQILSISGLSHPLPHRHRAEEGKRHTDTQQATSVMHTLYGIPTWTPTDIMLTNGPRTSMGMHMDGHPQPRPRACSPPAHGYAWTPTDAHIIRFFCLSIHCVEGRPPAPVGVHGHPWSHMGADQYPRTPTEVNDCPRVSTDVHGCPWAPADVQGRQRMPRAPTTCFRAPISAHGLPWSFYSCVRVYCCPSSPRVPMNGVIWPWRQFLVSVGRAQAVLAWFAANSPAYAAGARVDISHLDKVRQRQDTAAAGES